MAGKLGKPQIKRKSQRGRTPKEDDDILQAVCAGSFFLLYEAWSTGADLEKAFMDVVPEAAEEANYMMELKAMCSGEMFGHKEPSHGK